MNKKEVIDQAVEHLKNGSIILCPTDTIWGLSCDATNKVAVQKLLDLKKRDPNKSFIILLNSDAMINNCIKDMPSVAWDIIDLSNEPISLIMDGALYVAENAIHKDGSIAFRMIKSGFCFDLLTKFRKPIISTSPNFSGEKTPLRLNDINAEIKAKVAFQIPEEFAGEMSGKPSKILKIKPNGEVTIIRK
ncbi:MAG: Sua5/YciO/YrdC/YwlC family protein [Flavobacteriales bacterium]|nr:Sua5/YciO/YrdC/YwlC family protein [Flavobacteriales bacterium]